MTRDIAQVLHVSPTTITFDLQYLHKEAIKTIREYTTEQLPLQLRIFMVANQNAIKQYWDISGIYHKKHKITKKKYKPLNAIWNVISNYGLCCMEEKITWLDLVN